MRIFLKSASVEFVEFSAFVEFSQILYSFSSSSRLCVFVHINHFKFLQLDLSERWCSQSRHSVEFGTDQLSCHDKRSDLPKSLEVLRSGYHTCPLSVRFDRQLRGLKNKKIVSYLINFTNLQAKNSILLARGPTVVLKILPSLLFGLFDHYFSKKTISLVYNFLQAYTSYMNGCKNKFSKIIYFIQYLYI